MIWCCFGTRESWYHRTLPFSSIWSVSLDIQSFLSTYLCGVYTCHDDSMRAHELIILLRSQWLDIVPISMTITPLVALKWMLISWFEDSQHFSFLNSALTLLILKGKNSAYCYHSIKWRLQNLQAHDNWSSAPILRLVFSDQRYVAGPLVSTHLKLGPVDNVSTLNSSLMPLRAE